MLRCDNVNLSIKGTNILKDISFQVFPGECVALLGSSGAGKSSLFKLLTRELKPTKGSIYIDEFDITSLNTKNLQLYRKQIGIIFQDFKLLPQKTVYENIAYILQVSGDIVNSQKIFSVLSLVGLKDRAHAFPDTLSGGEKQRVAIARAMIHNPKILIADEATGNLDPKNSEEVGKILKKLNTEKGVTLFFSTHDPLLLDVLQPRVIGLRDGHIVFDKNNIDTREAFQSVE